MSHEYIKDYTCPCCESRDLRKVSPGDSTDPMGRDQWICGGCKARLNYNVGVQELQVAYEGQAWLNNYIQFGRLLGEISAIGMDESKWDELLGSMDLESDGLAELFDRAQHVFECDKQLTFQVSRRWVVIANKHETLVRERSGTKKTVAIFPMDIPENLRLFCAEMLASILNTDGRFGPNELANIMYQDPFAKAH